MKIEELTVNVKAKLGVDDETAETCLKIVELYCNQTGAKVIGTWQFDESVRFHFEKNNNKYGFVKPRK